MSNTVLGVVFVFGTLALVIISVRALLDTGFAFRVSSLTGEVMRERQRHETEVSGTVSGGGYSNSYVQGSVSSKTTRFQNIFLRLPNGKEREISFEDVELPCREGHRLSIVYLAREGHAEEVCTYHNHATDQSVTVPDVITSTVRPPVGRTTMLWGAAMLALLLLVAGPDGTLAEEGPAVALITCAVLVGGTMGVVGVVLRVLAGMRAAPRRGVVRQAIVDELAGVEAGLA